MKSPFPGMDPYLEFKWRDVHVNLVASARTALNDSLPPDLVALSEDRVSIDSMGSSGFHQFYPDVSISQPVYSATDLAGKIQIDAPLQIVIEPLTEVQHFVRIINPDDETVITILEFLSPSNKIGEGRSEYRKKRDELLHQGVHIVEIDLVRSGNWRRLLEPGKLKIETPYRVITRLATSTTASVYPIFYDKPLPKIQIPLRPGDSEVILELQPLIDATYRGGRYGQFIDYHRPLDPSTSPEEQKVIQKILTAAGKA